MRRKLVRFISTLVTPQTFINGERIGGNDDLRRHLDKSAKDPDAVTYTPVALLIGGVGAVSVYYAVYVQKRELKCACMGGSSNVPLGFISLTENLMMVAMAIWMSLSATILKG